MSTYKTGTVSVTNGSATVTGSGTAWAVALVAGGIFSSAGVAVPIASVTDDTHIVLDYNWPGSTAAGAGYSIALENAEAASVVDLNTTMSRVLVQLALAGIHPDLSGTIAERDALTLTVGDKGYFFLHAEIGYDLVFYRWTGTAWDGPFLTRGVAGIGSGGTIEGSTHAAASKATPVDADEMPLVDSAASFGLKKLTWANLKATMWTAWGALINAGTGKTTPVDADMFAIADSAASNATKKLTLANLKSTILNAAVRQSSNILINGNGAINQRGTTAPSDDIYAWDRHYVLTQTAAIGTSTLSNVANGLPSMMRLTQSQVTAQRMGVAQIVEGKNCIGLRGQTVTLLGKLRCSSAQAIRYAILEWTGTEDAPVSDVVNSWTNGTFTAGQFFNSTTLTVNQVGTITPSAATLTDFLLTATLGSSLTNLIVLIWTEGTAAQNVTLDVAWELLLGDFTGKTYPQSIRRSFGDELLLCQRYFQKTSPLATAPADGVFSGCIVVVAPAFTGFLAYHWRFQVSMRAIPTVATFSTGSGTAGYWRNAADTTSSQPLVTSAGTDACVIYLNNAGSQVWTSQGWQITASLTAEL